MSYYSIKIPSHSAQDAPMKITGTSFGAITPAVELLPADENVTAQNQNAPGYLEVMNMINQAISQTRVYVVESDITDTQNSIKTIVRQASF